MGSSERFYFIVITVLYFGAIVLPRNLASSREIHQEVACYRDRLRINCGDQSFIAIHEAFFTTRVRDNATCGPAIEHEEGDDEPPSTDPTEGSGCYEDIRVSVNRRCSGSRSCEYLYHEQSDKKCPNLRGQFVVSYDCVRNSSIVTYCNTKLEKREGYFSSPGFPQYYPKLSQCGWTISSSIGQTILLKVLHLHLRPATEVFPTVSDPDSMYAMGILGQLVSDEEAKCDVDSLTILDGNVKRAAVCGESTSALKTVEVESGEAEVNFKSMEFLPASGFLMYYKIQGCPVLPASEGNRLVEGNNSASVYVCDNGHVFNDTQESERFLRCVRDHHWNDTLPPCISLQGTSPTTTIGPIDSTDPQGNGTLPNAERTVVLRTTTEVAKSGYLEDILIPCILIGVLIVGNAIIVAIILVIRRRKKAKLEEEDENFDDPKSEPLVADVKDV